MKALRYIISYGLAIVALFATVLSTLMLIAHLTHIPQDDPLRVVLWSCVAFVIIAGCAVTESLFSASGWRTKTHTAPYGYVLVKRWPNEKDLLEMEPYKELLIKTEPPPDAETLAWVLSGCRRIWHSVIDQNRGKPVPRISVFGPSE